MVEKEKTIIQKNIDKSIKWLKNQNVRGCITGSSMLGYFEGQDVDLFLYDEKSFIKIYYAMYYNDMFQILDPLEKWKADKFSDSIGESFFKRGILTIKFTYNMLFPVNIILKKNTNNIFDVLSSFDMDIIAKGYDIQTKQYLDLTGDSVKTKIANWNKWNTNYYNPELWQISKLLRQIERVIKYHKRGYDTDNVTEKYIELIDKVQEYQDIFNSNNFSEGLKEKKKNTKTIKMIFEWWLENHEATDKTIELIRNKIKELK